MTKLIIKQERQLQSRFKYFENKVYFKLDIQQMSVHSPLVIMVDCRRMSSLVTVISHCTVKPRVQDVLTSIQVRVLSTHC